MDVVHGIVPFMVQSPVKSNRVLLRGVPWIRLGGGGRRVIFCLFASEISMSEKKMYVFYIYTL